MRTRTTVVLTLVSALVLGIPAVANASTTPNVSACSVTPPKIWAWPKVVKYPHSAWLKVATESTPSVILRRLAGASEWTTFTAGIETTRAVIRVNRPASTAAYKVVCDGVQSRSVRIGVAAYLTKPKVKSRPRVHHRVKLKGAVAPRHEKGNVKLRFYRWKKVGTKIVKVKVVRFKGKGKHKRKVIKIRKKRVARYKWVKVGRTVTVRLVPKNARWSKWSYKKWKPRRKGLWKIVVSHRDTAHVYSSASKRVRVRR